MTDLILKNFTPDETIPYDECGSWKAGDYLLDQKSAFALEMALATKRPLLVKGEPGMGKSYLALAAAAKLKRRFVAEVININTEGQDLLWRFDPVARLNDAHASKAGEPINYLNPGVLWWVYGWENAKKHYDEDCRHKTYQPHYGDGKEGKLDNGMVLLIDEIDKAEPSLPNSLLEVLGNGDFDIPMLGKTAAQDEPERPQPLVIITTNEERELPPAFMRRCLVLDISVEDDRFEDWMIERADVHISNAQCSHSIKRLAVKQLQKDRKDAEKQGMVKAGLAEFIDLLTALNEMTEPASLQGEVRDAYQEALLEEISGYVLRKAI